MDFDLAAKRLESEQSKLKGRRKPVISERAQREAQRRREQALALAEERQKKQAQMDAALQYMRECNRRLHTKNLSKSEEGLLLTATSIHGDGDKIALPPSVLQRLTQEQQTEAETSVSSPWTFRVGILNPNYKFPASGALKNFKSPRADDEDEAMQEDDEDDQYMAYLEELDHQYLCYSHATVVEFTQEEGYVGLPAPIASALLTNARETVPSTRTKDPSVGLDTTENAMEAGDIEEKTAGHVAFGAFDLPVLPIHVTLIHLPKGRTCALVPTIDAIQNGFYSLKDIKLVLEQSLALTRATLSVGDVVSTWHRGVEYPLRVEEVRPNQVKAISCINTDLEVEIGANQEWEDIVRRQQEFRSDSVKSGSKVAVTTSGQWIEGKGRLLGGGFKLSEGATEKAHVSATTSVTLLPEPPIGQTQDVCTVQIRAGNRSTARRRFDVIQATVGDLLAFASTIVADGNFQLVSRFPRRVFAASQERLHLKDAGLAEGQELLLVEWL
jgi:hypothetical protein